MCYPGVRVLEWLAVTPGILAYRYRKRLEMLFKASCVARGGGVQVCWRPFVEHQYPLKLFLSSRAGVFGGDPEDVTIFGQSAGGNSVLNHLAQPASYTHPLYTKVPQRYARMLQYSVYSRHIAAS